MRTILYATSAAIVSRSPFAFTTPETLSMRDARFRRELEILLSQPEIYLGDVEHTTKNIGLGYVLRNPSLKWQDDPHFCRLYNALQLEVGLKRQAFKALHVDPDTDVIVSLVRVTEKDGKLSLYDVKDLMKALLDHSLLYKV